MRFEHIHSPQQSLLPLNHPIPSHVLWCYPFSSFSMETRLCCLASLAIGACTDMWSAYRGPTSNKPTSSSPSSYQMPIAPQLIVTLHIYHPPLYCSGLVHSVIVSVSSYVCMLCCVCETWFHWNYLSVLQSFLFGFSFLSDPSVSKIIGHWGEGWLQLVS